MTIPRPPRRPSVLAVLAFVLALAAPLPAAAQGLPSRPLALFDGRLVLDGSVSVSVGPSDDRAYYNLTGYDISLLRMVQVALNSAFRLNPRAEVVVSLNGQTAIDAWNWNAYPSSAFVSVRPFNGRSVAVRAGIVPPAFGAFLQRGYYGADNLLIGYPLAYQYATSIRPDAFPASADELLRRRGLGAVARYSRGDAYVSSGLPLVNPFGWNPGVGVTAGTTPLNVSVALTRGGIASGRNRRADTGWEVSGRMEARPRPSLVLGVSGAHGSYADGEVAALLETAAFNRAPRETAAGFDAEYSRGYWLVRIETIVNRRTVPAFVGPYLSGPLWSRWVGAETRYKLFPGMYLAGRLERLSFSGVTGTALSDTWDANLTRLEAGGGYSLVRNLTLKMSYQRNWRDSHWYPRQQAVSGQVVLWF